MRLKCIIKNKIPISMVNGHYIYLKLNIFKKYQSIKFNLKYIWRARSYCYGIEREIRSDETQLSVI